MREDYHQGFEGNQCRHLLKRVARLEELVNEDFQKYPEKDYETHPMRIFSSSYDKCIISITSKVHAIKAHLEYFLDKHQTGLALFSEQAFEAIHSRFMKTWAKYKIKDKTNLNFFKALLMAVLDFNGANIVLTSLDI